MKIKILGLEEKCSLTIFSDLGKETCIVDGKENTFIINNGTLKDVQKIREKGFKVKVLRTKEELEKNSIVDDEIKELIRRTLDSGDLIVSLGENLELRGNKIESKLKPKPDQIIGPHLKSLNPMADSIMRWKTIIIRYDSYGSNVFIEWKLIEK